MVYRVSISQHSKDLSLRVKELLLLVSEEERPHDNVALLSWLEEHESETEINALDLVVWLDRRITLDKKAQFLLESLRTALLHDLYHSIPDRLELDDTVDPQSNNAFFRFLTIAGTTVAICEGFDGVVSILGLFPAIPPVVIFMAGIAFAALSVIVFCGFDLVTISKNLGVDKGKSYQLIDVYLEQVEQINKLREAICIRCTLGTSEEQDVLLQMSNMLVTRYAALDSARQKYKADLSATSLIVAKSVTSAVGGIVFFGGGFFSGQSLALAAASLFTTSASALFWPVIVASLLVGVAACSIYWFVQRPGLESLVSRWLGIDEEKIDALIDDSVVNRQRRGLEQLVRQVTQVGEFRRQGGLTLFTQVLNQDIQPISTSEGHTSVVNSVPNQEIQLMPNSGELSPIGLFRPPSENALGRVDLAQAHAHALA
jgi:hypothetical protein